VWSNCIAGWWLGGGGSISNLILICIGGTSLYVGGMFLNDAFDAEFDRQRRKERPIPSGAISEARVWTWGVIWMVIGAGLLSLLGESTWLLALLLAAAILLYNALHKRITFSPVLMALCRFFLFLAAASGSSGGITGLVIWTALALGAYIVGLSYIARRESVSGPLRYWPCAFLGAPVLLAWIVNAGTFRLPGLIFSVILAAWAIHALRSTLWSAEKNIGRTVSRLLAGIVLVDLLSIAGGGPALTLTFLLLFIAALSFQRWIPAT
jgi:4-hydroxybenzoate polyprenyltransferase